MVSLHGWVTPSILHSSYIPFKDHVNKKQFILIEPRTSSTFLTGMNLNMPGRIIDGVIKKLKSERGNKRRLSGKSIDWTRLYLSGHSAGGRASYIYASSRNNVAGMVILAGDGSGADLSGVTDIYTKPKQPTGLIHIHGTFDYIVPHMGGKEVYKAYRKHNGCKGETSSRKGRVTVKQGTDCKRPTYLYSIFGEDHYIFLNRYKIADEIIDKLLSMTLYEG